MKNYASQLQLKVIDEGLCIGCGICCALDQNKTAKLVNDKNGETIIQFGCNSYLPKNAWSACPGKGVDYPRIFKNLFGGLPKNWTLGWIQDIWTGYSLDAKTRHNSSSGGVSTEVLKFLLDEGYVDGVIVAKQGNRASLLEPSWAIVYQSSELVYYSQSVYINVPMLSCLAELDSSKKYAITVTPEHCSALRELQISGCKSALSIKYVLGPYTGTSLETKAIQGLFKIYGVSEKDKLLSLKWRAGNWPGFFEAKFSSGHLIRIKKVYYNFLIPFYIARASLTSIDFANDFTDLSVGDAWSPKFEGKSMGHSVVLCRTKKMLSIIKKMRKKNLLSLDEIDPLVASDMHGHMIDFKRRGAFIRRSLFRALGRQVPDNGLYPLNLPSSRVFLEIPMFFTFLLCRTRLARYFMILIPPTVMGSVFDRARLLWKSLSRPAKRKGLRMLQLGSRTPIWRSK